MSGGAFARWLPNGTVTIRSMRELGRCIVALSVGQDYTSTPILFAGRQIWLRSAVVA